MIMISFAGRIFTVFSHVEVERIEIINEDGYEILEDNAIKIAIDETYQMLFKIYPEKAKNKNVTYSSTNPNICDVDENGLVKGIAYGYSTIIVKTEENHKTDRVTIKVTNERVEAVDITLDTINLPLHGQQQLIANIIPQSAIEKRVTWTSSNPEIVSVDYNGVIKALQTTGQNEYVIITARSIENNDAFDEVRVSVQDFVIAFKSEILGQSYTNSPTQSLDLWTQIEYNTSMVDLDEIKFEVISGNGTINDGHTLYFVDDSNPVAFVTVKASIIGTSYSTSTTFYYQFN